MVGIPRCRWATHTLHDMDTHTHELHENLFNMNLSTSFCFYTYYYYTIIVHLVYCYLYIDVLCTVHIEPTEAAGYEPVFTQSVNNCDVSNDMCCPAIPPLPVIVQYVHPPPWTKAWCCPTQTVLEKCVEDKFVVAWPLHQQTIITHDFVTVELFTVTIIIMPIIDYEKEIL